MKSYFLLIISCLFPLLLPSQHHTVVDSLKYLLNKSNDEKQLVYLLELSDILYTSSPAQSFEYATKASIIAEKRKDLSSKARAYQLMGISKYYLTSYDEAMRFYNQALLLFSDLNDKKSVARLYNSIGSIYKNWGNYEKANECFQHALEISEKMNDDEGQVMSLSNIGVIYKSLGNYEQALEYYKQALSINTISGDKRSIAYSLNNIGNLYKYWNNTEKSIEYYKESLKIKKSINDQQGIAITLFNLAESYVQLKMIDTALNYFRHSQEISERIGDKEGVVYSLNGIGNLYIMQKEYEQARKILSKGLDLAEQFKLKNQIKLCNKYFADLYEQTGNYEKAYYYFKKYAEIKDTLFTEESAMNIAQLQAKYQNDKNEAIRQLEIKKQKTLRDSFIIGFILVSLLAIVILRSFYIKKRDNKIIETERAKADNLLLNILPYKVAFDLKETGESKPQNYEQVTLFFSDFIDFTGISSKLEPENLINELNDIYTAFDDIMKKYNCERIKTIGDAYLAVCGLPLANTDHASNIIRSGLDILNYLKRRNQNSEIQWQIRAGIHSGKVVGGIVGVRKYIFDIFGDSINIASRLQNIGKPMMLTISESTYSITNNQFDFIEKETILIKGKGQNVVYYME
ncbi:tetratricopeptide repeat protein [candidate division KSB1 bacterium]